MNYIVKKGAISVKTGIFTVPKDSKNPKPKEILTEKDFNTKEVIERLLKSGVLGKYEKKTDKTEKKVITKENES